MVKREPELDIQQLYDLVQESRPRIGLLQGCRSIEDFEHLNVIDEGTFGVVYRAKDKKTG
jgi:hypothetical protein